MPDEKFSKELDRQAILFDYKNRLIDLLDNHQPLPETGIYDEPVRYFKANLEWCKVIFGWLSHLQSEAGWQDAEDHSYRGIQEILIFEEGIEMATKEDIRDGMYEALNRLALQIVTGQYADVSLSTDTDGTVTQTPEGDLGVEIPEDDPLTTAIDESLASQMAGAVAVARGIEAFWDRLDTNYGATNGTPAMTAVDCKFIIKSYFPVDETLMSAAIDDYYLFRNSQPRILFNVTTAFQDILFCYGATRQSINRWLIDTSGYAVSKIAVLNTLINALADEFFSQYFAIGAAGQDTGYKTAPCTKIDTEEYTLNMATADSFAFLTGTWKDNHRYLIETTGSFVDSDNPNLVKDFFWTLDTSTGGKTFDGFTLTHSGTTAPVASQVPYQAGHVYAVTMEKTGNNAGTITKTNGIFSIPNTVGTMTLKITDMGLIS